MTTVDRAHADHVRTTGAPAASTIDVALLRHSLVLLLAGQLLYVLVTQFHAGGDANDHEAIFATYAGDDRWKAVHVGQFLAMSLLVAGLLVMCIALRAVVGRTAWASRLAAAAALVALALYGVLQALDGVGNQEIDRAWVAAPEDEKAARFASAEAVRWLEWGVRSYHDYALGLALLLLAAAVSAMTGIPRAPAYLIGASGVVYLVQGWVVGAEGFSGTHTSLILLGWVVSLVWMIWLLTTLRSHGAGRSRVAP